MAQQQSLYSSFLLNGFVYNPALAGVEDHLDLKTSFRRQWMSVPGSPITTYASLHGAVNQSDLNKEELGSLPMRGSSSIKFKYEPPRKIRHGVGGFVRNDKAGLINHNTLSLGYSIHLPIGQKYYLAIGAAATAHTFNLENPVLRDQGDDAFAGNLNFGTMPDAQFGMYLYSDRLQIGLSGTQLAANKMSFAENNKGVSLPLPDISTALPHTELALMLISTFCLLGLYDTPQIPHFLWKEAPRSVTRIHSGQVEPTVMAMQLLEWLAFHSTR
jgi:type IX secretion system PorP/SprF family membrane protein